MGVSSLLSEGLDSSSEEIIQSFSDKFQVPYLTASVAAMKPGMLESSTYYTVSALSEAYQILCESSRLSFQIFSQSPATYLKVLYTASGNKFDLLSSNLNWCNKFEWKSFETPSSNFHIGHIRCKLDILHTRS